MLNELNIALKTLCNFKLPYRHCFNNKINTVARFTCKAIRFHPINLSDVLLCYAYNIKLHRLGRNYSRKSLDLQPRNCKRHWCPTFLLIAVGETIDFPLLGNDLTWSAYFRGVLSSFKYSRAVNN